MNRKQKMNGWNKLPKSQFLSLNQIQSDSLANQCEPKYLLKILIQHSQMNRNFKKEREMSSVMIG